MTVVVWRDERREGEKEAQRTDLRRLAPPLNPSLSEPPPQTIRAALAEDAGDAGDLTTASTIPAGTPATATFTAKAAGVVAGLGVADAVFRAVDPSITPTWLTADGQAVTAGTLLGTATGPAASLLIAERVALNFMQRMGGIASAAAAMVAAVRAGSPPGAPPCTLLDTRKTAPGLRLLDKWGVLIGGGANHRLGLYDMVMVKDNHAAAAGGVGPAAAAARAFLLAAGRPATPIEVEARTLAEVAEVLAIVAADPSGCGITRLMLDNMVSVDGSGVVDTSLLAEAVALVRACKAAAGLETEASGGVTLASAGAIAGTGVSHVSCGAITHSSPALDISMGLRLGGEKKEGV